MNERRGYGAVAKLLHFVYACLAIAFLASGGIGIPESTPEGLRFGIETISSVHHGVAPWVIVFTVICIFWRFINANPILDDSAHGGGSSFFVFLMHYALYLTIFASAILTVILSQWAGHEVLIYEWKWPILFHLEGGGLLDFFFESLPLPVSDSGKTQIFSTWHIILLDASFGLVLLHICFMFISFFGGGDRWKKAWSSS